MATPFFDLLKPKKPLGVNVITTLMPLLLSVASLLASLLLRAVPSCYVAQSAWTSKNMQGQSEPFRMALSQALPAQDWVPGWLWGLSLNMGCASDTLSLHPGNRACFSGCARWLHRETGHSKSFLSLEGLWECFRLGPSEHWRFPLSLAARAFEIMVRMCQITVTWMRCHILIFFKGLNF